MPPTQKPYFWGPEKGLRASFPGKGRKKGIQISFLFDKIEAEEFTHTLPPLQKNSVNVVSVFAWGFGIEKMAGTFGESYVISVYWEAKQEKSSKNSGQIQRKIQENQAVLQGVPFTGCKF